MADGSSNSISVTVRVRPFTIREAAQLTKNDDSPLFFGDGSLAGVPQQPKLLQKGIRPVIKVVDDRCLVFDPPEDNPIHRFSKSVLPQGKRVKDQTFIFDKVFDENTSQSDVYEATTKNLLDSVLDGYNATVFAYGATGCGKTHTITGTVQQPGIIFLTMQELFERIADLQSDKTIEISLSYLEIYNETIRDLLVSDGSKTGLTLREDAQQSVSVAGLSSHHPQNVQEVMDMIVQGNECRTMSPTEANATSSRSHAVLQINVAQRDRNASVSEPHTMATLSIIDLAGSERASATKNRGERLIEGANINKSLLALGSCINALCDRRQRNHVPYRNSKLTRLLKFSLGGNCKTVMIVCVSPSSAHFDETQNTLRYANRAKNIQTKVTRNVYNVNRHVKDFLKKIDEQMTLINELKQQQADYEGVAFAKFRKQEEKKQSIIKEGIARLRGAYDNCSSERQERMSHMKKLRQIERRITLVNSWIAAFDSVCESREEDEEGLSNLAAMRKTAQGISIELEGSRHHYHQRLSKNNWQRTIDTALQTGLKQLQDVDDAVDSFESQPLEIEAELIKTKIERELYMAILEQEKGSDAALTQVLLQAHFETVSNIDRLLKLPEEETTQATTEILQKMLKSCTDVASFVIKPEGAPLPVTEVFPPTKSGTPKRRRHTSLVGPSPMKPQLQSIAESRYSLSTPMKSSPRRIKLGSARKVRLSPQKKSPVKRAVRWRDDEENGQLADYSKTPSKEDESCSGATETIEIPPPPTLTMPDLMPTGSRNSSSPVPTPPKASLDIYRPKADRFQAGFLSRKPALNGAGDNETSPPSVSNSVNSSSAEASPLQEITHNKPSARVSSEGVKRFSTDYSSAVMEGQNENNPNYSSASDSDDSSRSFATPKSAQLGSKIDGSEQQISLAMKRSSLSRSNSLHGQGRTQRRRSPSASGTSPPQEKGLFTASHARRMVKSSERESDWRMSSVLSPHATPIMKSSTGSLGPGGINGHHRPSHMRASISGIKPNWR